MHRRIAQCFLSFSAVTVQGILYPAPPRCTFSTCLRKSGLIESGLGLDTRALYDCFTKITLQLARLLEKLFELPIKDMPRSELHRDATLTHSAELPGTHAGRAVGGLAK
jgi:hypothetical protein